MVEMIQVLDEHLRVVVVIALACVVVLGTLAKVVTNIFTTACRERSRREIAAYIAEGALTPEQGERLIRANVNNDKQFNF